MRSPKYGLIASSGLHPPLKSHPWQEMNVHCRHLRPFSADPHHLLWPCERMCLSTKKKLPTGSASDKCCSCLSLLLQFSNTYVAPTSGLYNLISITHKKKARFKDGYESGPLWLRIALSLHNTPARKQVLAPLSTIHATPLKGLGATLSHPGEQKAKEGKQQTLANGFAQKITPSL